MDTQTLANVTSPDLAHRAALRPQSAMPAQAANKTPENPVERKITRQDVEAATKKVQSFVEAKTSELQFSVDDTSGMAVVKVFDKSTKELIRQIPSQEVLDMAVALERIQGLLLKQKA